MPSTIPEDKRPSIGTIFLILIVVLLGIGEITGTAGPFFETAELILGETGLVFLIGIVSLVVAGLTWPSQADAPYENAHEANKAFWSIERADSWLLLTVGIVCIAFSVIKTLFGPMFGSI